MASAKYFKYDVRFLRLRSRFRSLPVEFLGVGDPCGVGLRSLPARRCNAYRTAAQEQTTEGTTELVSREEVVFGQGSALHISTTDGVALSVVL